MPWVYYEDWPQQVRALVTHVANHKHISHIGAAHEIWLLAEQVIGFPIGWIRTGKEIADVCSAVKSQLLGVE